MTRPPHAYIPGQTPRHPEGTFDHIRDTAEPGMRAQDLAQTPAFLTGLDYLNTGYFWEAHELLEPVWMALPNPSPERALVQALIQLANARLKLRMSRPKAALRLTRIAQDLMPAADGALMGLNLAHIHHEIETTEGKAISAL